MKTSKRAASLSINIIIVAIIALLVLVIMVLIFSNSARDFVRGSRDCVSLGGTCRYKESDNKPCPSGYVSLSTDSCGEGMACCQEIIPR